MGASDEVYNMMGYALPLGTIVATQAWSMHRDPSIFPSPHTFLPECWLENSSTTLDQLFTMVAYTIPLALAQEFAAVRIRSSNAQGHDGV